jgi:hypothetical protein
LAHMPDRVVHKSDDGFERVASAAVLADVLDIPKAQQTSAHGQRLAHAMKHVKWDRTPSGRVTIKGEPVRGYIRPARESSPQQEKVAMVTQATAASTSGNAATDIKKIPPANLDERLKLLMLHMHRRR